MTPVKVSEENPEPTRTNISERAIGRTYHKLSDAELRQRGFAVNTQEESRSSGKCSDCDCETDAEPSSYCGKEVVVCDRCDEDYEWCSICQTHKYTNFQSPCRHLFYSDGEWLGSGSHETDWETCKPGFFAMLELIGVTAVQALKASLGLHKYFHQFSGTIFGYHSITADWFDESGSYRDWGYTLNSVMSHNPPADAEGIAIGVQWLVSLYAGCHGKWEPKTPEADLVTIQWIDEWLAGKQSQVNPSTERLS
jgi:hypothetical protein